jgi:hypothetical protein
LSGLTAAQVLVVEPLDDGAARFSVGTFAGLAEEFPFLLRRRTNGNDAKRYRHAFVIDRGTSTTFQSSFDEWTSAHIAATAYERAPVVHDWLQDTSMPLMLETPDVCACEGCLIHCIRLNVKARREAGAPPSNAELAMFRHHQGLSTLLATIEPGRVIVGFQDTKNGEPALNTYVCKHEDVIRIFHLDEIASDDPNRDHRLEILAALDPRAFLVVVQDLDDKSLIIKTFMGRPTGPSWLLVDWLRTAHDMSKAA